MKWTNKTKDVVAHMVAGIMLLFGMVLVIWGFLTPPPGEVHDSIIWIFAQILVFGGAVLGISLHVDNTMKTIEGQILDKLKSNDKKDEKI